MRRPTVSQTASAASSRPGSSSTGRAPAKPSAAVSPGASASPCTATRASRASTCTLVSLRPAPVPPMATMAVGVLGRQRDVEPAPRLVEAHGAAAPLDVGRHQARRRADDCAAAQRQDAHARLAHGDAGQAGGGEGGEIERTQPVAGAAQRQAGLAIAAGRQHAVARIDGDQRLGAGGALLHRVEGRDAVGAGRHGLARLHPRRHPRQQRRRIAAGAERQIGGERPAVGQRGGRAGRAGAATSAASVRPAAGVTSSVRGVTGFTSASISPSTSASGVRREIQLQGFAIGGHGGDLAGARRGVSRGGKSRG